MALTQASRTLQIDTPLGADEVLLTSFSGAEELSRLFQFQLDLVSENTDIAAEDIVGKNVTFSIDYDHEDGKRYFNGFVQRFAAGDEDPSGRRGYHAIVVPWLWFLTQTTDCRIFQEMTVVEIIEKIFDDLGFSDFDVSQVRQSHPKREYCVQYRETDFEFVSRLMEEEGIFYYFKHEQGKHNLMLADSASAYVDCLESSVDYPLEEQMTGVVKAHLHSWEHVYEFRSGAWAHTDYNFKTPKQKLMTTEKTLMKFQKVKEYEQYDYPGEYPDKGIGAPLARVRMEELELEHNMVAASSSCKSFSPGERFKVERHRCSAEEGKSYVIMKVLHVAHEKGEYETGVSDDTPEYENKFVCFPDTATFRPKRSTRKPIVQGPQTAVVVGPAGSEIYTDEFSRVKVQFFWDREGKSDDQSGCWIRVSQAWAGQNWGFVCIPRIGQEVIVGFLEGDPDQPIIIGRVYNAEQMPPYELPSNMTQSGIKTRSSQGGGSDNFNELRFEDKSGSEEVYLHAEKDLNIVVENDRAEEIGRDRQLHVGRDKSETVDRNKTISVLGGHTETISKSMTINVGASLTETIAVGYVENVGGAMALTVGAALAVSVGGGSAETVGGAKAENIAGSKTENVGTNLAVTTGGTLSESVGKDRTMNVIKDVNEKIGGKHVENVEKEYMLTAKKINVVAKDEMQLTCGSASITLKKNGDIMIKGKKINVKGSSDVIIKGSQVKAN
ncbi:MAG: type VI secretion system tip protein VgrG [Planctomycetales bacterium]|nr:type VI secretion system tip protein VgrG [Planctomycetales bacterium]